MYLCPELEVPFCNPLQQCCPAGVRLKDGKELEADLVVDASGRRSKLPSWLEEAGYQPPAESHVDSHMAYAMRLYAIMCCGSILWIER